MKDTMQPCGPNLDGYAECAAQGCASTDFATIAPHDRRPLFVRVAEHLRETLPRRQSAACAGGIPTSRELSRELGVNTNTVLRALRLMRDEGLIDFRRGRPITLCPTMLAPSDPVAVEAVRSALRAALAAGYTRRNLVAVFDEVVSSPGTRLDLPTPAGAS